MNTEAAPHGRKEEAGVSAEVLMLLLDQVKDLAEAARGDVRPGRHAVREVLTVDLRGTVTVGLPYTQRIVAKARPWALVAVLLEELSEAQVAAGASGVNLDALVGRAMQLDPKLEAEARERADKVAALLKAETVTTCRGRVTCSGHAEVRR